MLSCSGREPAARPRRQPLRRRHATRCVPLHHATPDDASAQSPSATPQLVFPTPTPLTYTVVEGDNLNGIAEKFGVTLSDLLAANPEVTGSTLSIGTVLTIPTTPISTPIAGPTPVPLPFTRVDCWPSGDGGMWCFAALTNSTGDTLENLIAQISLLDAEGVVVRHRPQWPCWISFLPESLPRWRCSFPHPSRRGNAASPTHLPQCASCPSMCVTRRWHWRMCWSM